MAPFPKRPFTRVCSLQPGTWLCPVWQPVTRGHRWRCQPGRPECTRPLLEQPPGNSASPAPPGQGLQKAWATAAPKQDHLFIWVGGTLGHSVGALAGDVCLSLAIVEERARAEHTHAEVNTLTARAPPPLGPPPAQRLAAGPSLCLP